MAWAPAYATVADLRDYRGITDTADDAQLGLAVEAASRAIDRHCSRQFGLAAAAEARRYTAHYSKVRCAWVVDVDDLMTLTGLVVEFDPAHDLTFSAAVTSSMVDWSPANAGPRGRPWTRMTVIPALATASPDATRDGVRITARWGWTSVPDTIRQACLLQSHRLIVRRQSPLGDITSPVGPSMRVLAKVDADVAVSLSDYVRRWGAR